MSGHLSKFHFRLKQSVGNQSSQSELLPHSPSATMACGPGNIFAFNHMQILLSLRTCSSPGPSHVQPFKKRITPSSFSLCCVNVSPLMYMFEEQKDSQRRRSSWQVASSPRLDLLREADFCRFEGTAFIMHPLLTELRSRLGLREGTGAGEQGYQQRRNENLLGKGGKGSDVFRDGREESHLQSKKDTIMASHQRA